MFNSIDMILSKKLYLLLVTIVLSFMMLIATIINVQGDEEDQKILNEVPEVGKNIFVEITTGLEQPSSALIFTIRNRSKMDIRSMWPAVSWNSIIMINPKGEVLRHRIYGDVEHSKIPLIKSGETKSWGKDDFFPDGPWTKYKEFFEERGLYYLYWEGKIEWEPTAASYKYLMFNSITLFFKENKTDGIIRTEGYEKITSETTEDIKKEGLGELLFKKKEKTVFVEIAHVLDKSATLLECILTNNTKEEIETTPTCTNDSEIVIVTPDGVEKECTAIKNDKEKEKIIIKPSDTKSWRIDIKEIAKTYNISLEKPGTYKVYWKMSLVNKDGEKDKKQQFISSPVFFCQPDKDDKSGSDNSEKPK